MVIVILYYNVYEKSKDHMTIFFKEVAESWKWGQGQWTFNRQKTNYTGSDAE